MKAAVVIDDYKLGAFEKALKNGGFKFEKRAGPKKLTFILVVEYDEDTKPALVKLVNKTNIECSRGVN